MPASYEEMCTSSEFLRSPLCPSKDICPGGKGWGHELAQSINLGETLQPRDCVHLSVNFVSSTVRGAIKHGFTSRLLKDWRVESVWNEGGGHLEGSKIIAY